MKLKHYKGDGWEVKVKYDEDLKALIFASIHTNIPCTSDSPQINDLIDRVINGEYGKYGGGLVYMDYNKYEELTDHLDKLTKPKIINEREFKNDNFHIKVWETEDKIGAETVWIRKGFDYDCEIGIDRNYAQAFTSNYKANEIADFGLNTKDAELQVHKEEINYTFTDLCKALERAEQETNELTYDTVVKELEGLEGRRYLEQLTKYEYCIGEVNLGSEAVDFKKTKWFNLRWFGSMHKEGRLAILPYNINLDYLGRGCERGLIKLRRVK